MSLRQKPGSLCNDVQLHESSLNSQHTARSSQRIDQQFAIDWKNKYNYPPQGLVSNASLSSHYKRSVNNESILTWTDDAQFQFYAHESTPGTVEE